MADAAQVRRMNPVVKYLLILIAIVFSMLFVSVISIYTYYNLAIGEKITGQAEDTADLPVEASFRFESEFVAPSADEKNGIIKFKLELGISDRETLGEFLRANNARLRDMIQRRVMSLKVEEAKKLYREETLHKQIMKDINDFIIKHKPAKMTFLGKMKKLRVVEVNFEDFFASLVE